MDCYFRQYWRDNRLSFKGLKQTANNVIINQVLRNMDNNRHKIIWKGNSPSVSQRLQLIKSSPKWCDEFYHHQLSLNVKMLEKIWKPDTYFHNGLDSYLHTITRLRIQSDYSLWQFWFSNRSFSDQTSCCESQSMGISPTLSDLLSRPSTRRFVWFVSATFCFYILSIMTRCFTSLLLFQMSNAADELSDGPANLSPCLWIM